MEDTYLAGREFEAIEVENSDVDWYHCFVRNGKFEGAGGPEKLTDILDVFREWAETQQD